jgi:hypothetical protein
LKGIDKTKEEQEKDFEIIKEYASPNCKYCLGTGKEYWITELKMYKPCECVHKNIKRLRERGLN